MVRGRKLATLVLATAMVPAALAPAASAAFPEDFVDLMFGTLDSVLSQTVPSSEAQLLLVGTGVFDMERNGKTGTCQDEVRFVLEASPKPLGLEPGVTFTFGSGTHEEPTFWLPCALGHTHQPVKEDISGSFDGAWTATKVFDRYWWTFSVSAPDEGGQRTVTYEYHATDDSVHDHFTGTGIEYR